MKVPRLLRCFKLRRLIRLQGQYLLDGILHCVLRTQYTILPASHLYTLPVGNWHVPYEIMKSGGEGGIISFVSQANYKRVLVGR